MKKIKELWLKFLFRVIQVVFLSFSDAKTVTAKTVIYQWVWNLLGILEETLSADHLVERPVNKMRRMNVYHLRVFENLPMERTFSTPELISFAHDWWLRVLLLNKKTFSARRGQWTNQKYRNLVGSDQQMQRLKKLNWKGLTLQLGLIVINFPIFCHARLDFFRECLQLGKHSLKKSGRAWRNTEKQITVNPNPVRLAFLCSAVLLSPQSEGLGREWLKGLFQFLVSHRNDRLFPIELKLSTNSLQNLVLPIPRWKYAANLLSSLILFTYQDHSRPQRPRSFWSAPKIATSDWVRFFEHAQRIRFVLSANQIC